MENSPYIPDWIEGSRGIIVLLVLAAIYSCGMLLYEIRRQIRSGEKVYFGKLLLSLFDRMGVTIVALIFIVSLLLLTINFLDGNLTSRLQ